MAGFVFKKCKFLGRGNQMWKILITRLTKKQSQFKHKALAMYGYSEIRNF